MDGILIFKNFYMFLHNIQTYTIFFFLLSIVLISFIWSLSYYNFFFINIKHIINFFFFLIFFIFFFFFSFFYIKFISCIDFIDSNINTANNHLFSETLILLSIIITLISWIFLSERYLLKSFFFILYFLIFIVCTINMVYADNIFIMFIFFEFIFLPSLFFVYQFGYSKKIDKTIFFLLIWTFSGSLLVFFGITYLYLMYNMLDTNSLSTLRFTLKEKYFLFFVFFFGFGVKIPIWPFHYWLTKVHVEAPTGFSIFLSGFLVKTALFCFTYFYFLFHDKIINQIILVFIIIGLLDSSMRMWASIDIKRLIAFATIQEMNLILMFLVECKNTNYTFINLFLIVHGLLSALLFYLIEQVQKQTSTRNLTSISGIVYYSSKLTVFMWLSILIFRGFPIFIKFLIEWEILSIFYLNFDIFGIFLFIFINSLAVLGFSRIWFIILYGQPLHKIKINDLLKKDFYLGLFIIIVLFFLNFFMFLFIG